MILFVYGPETYLVREKVGQIVAKAISQDVPENSVARLDAAEVEPAELATSLRSQGLFSERQVIVIRDLLQVRSADEAAIVTDGLDSANPEAVIVFAEYGNPDKRRSAFKQLVKLADKTWDFPSMEEGEARRWATKYAAAQETTVSPGAVNKLVTDVGTDGWTLATELDKLATAADSVTEETVAALVTPDITGDIFALVDALGRRDTKSAMGSLTALLANGEPPLRIMAMIVRQYRILIAVHGYADQGMADGAISGQLRASVGNVPPFVVAKTRRQVGLFTEAELRRNFEHLSDIDFEVKTGRRDAETALELFVVESSEPAVTER